VGSPGRRAFTRLIRGIRERYAAHFIVANCENSAGGVGVTPQIAQQLLDAGADCLTSGNHIWRYREIYDYIEQEPRLLRPANFPPETPGTGYGVYQRNGHTFAVVNLMGRAFMDPLECPFRAFDDIRAEIGNAADAVMVDFHAETTAEKVAFGWYADGRAHLVVGTHTHVPTADERVLPGGTAYITDVGMTGPLDSVLGMDREIVLRKFLTQLPVRFEVPEQPATLMGVAAEIDPTSGKAVWIERFRETASE